MLDKPKTRIATIEDTPELARLNGLFNDIHEKADALAERLRNPQRVETPILAEINNHIVGFAAVRIVPTVFYTTPHAELTELFVEESHRRKGIGQALITHVEQFARENGASELVVLTGSDNEASQALYRGMGFEDLDQALVKSL